MRAMLVNSRPLIYFMVVAVFTLSLPRRPAEATLVATESAIAGAPDAETNHARVRAFLDRQDVQVQLEAYGINVDEARARVESLTDDEVALIAGKLDELSAGGNPAFASLFGPPSFAAAAAFIGFLVLVVVALIVWHVKHRSSKNTAVEKAD